MKRIYISGPMTGRIDLNFPAFHAEAEHALWDRLTAWASVSIIVATLAALHFHWI